MPNTLHRRLMKEVVIAVCLVLLAGADAWAKSVVVFGLDETGSYELRQQGLSILKAIVQQLEPEDVLYVRRITEQSYVDQKSVLMRLAIPPVPEASGNTFDMKSRAKRQQAIRTCELLKAKAIQAIDAIQPVKAPKTDIWGYLLAAQERLALEPTDAEKLILICSDMQDNVNYKPELKLQGIRIMVVGFEKLADPAATKKLQDQWRAQLRNKGAQSVEFFSADVPLQINR